MKNLSALFLFILFVLIASALPSSAQAEDKPDLTIIFHQYSSQLPAGSQTALDQLLAQYAKQSSLHQRITILAFAALPDQPVWAAVRLALTRALAIRDYFLQKNIPPKHIILKPIGNLCAAPCQRVDIFLTKP